MAYRKRRSTYKKHQPEYMIDLIGIGLVLAGILGIGKYGPVGEFLTSIAIFFVGSLYMVLLIFVIGLGIYIMIKREKINFFSSKLMGIYLFLIGVLIFLHQTYLVDNLKDQSVLSGTMNYLMTGMETVMKGTAEMFDPAIINTGGGFIGGLFTSICYKLVDVKGTNIVIWVLLAAGFMIFTGLSIMDIIKDTYEKGRDILPAREEKEEENEERPSKNKVKIIDHNEPENGKIVVQDLSEITRGVEERNKEDKKEAVYQNKSYALPSIELLDLPIKGKKSNDKAQIERNSELLEKVLLDFGIVAKVVEVNIGPTVVQYELQLHQGTKVSKLLGIDREISLALAKKDVRIQAPIPGKNTVGIEMPNEEGQIVTLRETLIAIPSSYESSKLTVGLGKDIMGRVAYTELDKTPHLLVAGATGSGKSVCINGIIISLLMRTKPDEVKLMLIDPKKVELSIYNGVPHLLRPVVTDSKEASIALKKIVSMMESRYNILEEAKAKNITSYNHIIEEKNRKLSEEDQIQKMPYIVVIIDELADLMIVAAKEVEDSITRITQLARAAGIHLIVATQRPSTDVITGLIKANIPSRLSFSVASSIDSRTILDMKGAEKLLGKGDMLYLPQGENAPQRIQGAFLKEDEIKRIIDHTVEQQKASYDGNFLNLSEREHVSGTQLSADGEEYDDPLYNEIVEFVVMAQKASSSLLQRKFKLGYNRAARIIDLLEERGIIGPQNGSKPREVLIQLEKDYDDE